MSPGWLLVPETGSDGISTPTALKTASSLPGKKNLSGSLFSSKSCLRSSKASNDFKEIVGSLPAYASVFWKGHLMLSVVWDPKNIADLN